MRLLEIIEGLRSITGEVSKNIGLIKVGIETKREFIKQWISENRSAKIVDNQIRISSSNAKPPSAALTDELLTILSFAVELYDEYDRVKALIESLGLPAEVYNKIGADLSSAVITTEEMASIEARIAEADFNPSDVLAIKEMLKTKSDRRETIGPFKQIGRGNDNWGPALALITQTLANDALPNLVVKFLQRHRGIADHVKSDYNNRLTSVPVAGLITLAALERFGPMIPSLLTKPFVILTGGSGTGKTKLAEAVAHHYSDEEGANIEVVAVGADWTDNRNVLGFVNHLREAALGGGETAQRRPVYQSTPVVDLLLRARERPLLPHFLILDEMNLSHVERYFADFLSAMEQADGRLHLHDEGDSDAVFLPRYDGDTVGVPGTLELPANLFVIGTVNVDETTYMFSPKVLDRANVLEFKVEATDIEAFLESPRGYPAFERAEPGQAEAFLQLALRARLDPEAEGGLEDLSGAAAEAVRRHLLDLFRILHRGRFEYAYRTANEVMRYLRVSRHLATDKSAWEASGWQPDVDAQILQKLLPKLHGSAGRIGPLLVALAEYCHAGTVTRDESDRREHAAMRLKEAESLSEESAVFPASLHKLKAMIRGLNEEQFVSFIQ